MVSTMLSLTTTLVMSFLATQTNGVEGKLVAGKPWFPFPLPVYPVKPKPVKIIENPVFSYDAFYDFKKNVVESSPYVTGSLSGSGCSTRGTLKLALASAASDPKRRRVLVDLFFENPTGFSFNLGDSQTNNGYAGDSGTQSRDAEVHSKGKNFVGFLSDSGGSIQAFLITDIINTRLTLIAGDGHLVWLPDNSNLFNYYFNNGFFALNGQADSEGPVNYDLYLGVNQVIAGSYRSGTGLCKVGIKFLPEY